MLKGLLLAAFSVSLLTAVLFAQTEMANQFSRDD